MKHFGNITPKQGNAKAPELFFDYNCVRYADFPLSGPEFRVDHPARREKMQRAVVIRRPRIQADRTESGFRNFNSEQSPHEKRACTRAPGVRMGMLSRNIAVAVKQRPVFGRGSVSFIRPAFAPALPDNAHSEIKPSAFVQRADHNSAGARLSFKSIHIAQIEHMKNRLFARLPVQKTGHDGERVSVSRISGKTIP